MKNLSIFLFILLVVILQLSVAGVFFPENQIPDLALAFVITLVLSLGFSDSIKWILLTGVLIDAGSNTTFGTTALAFFLIGWLVSWIVDVADLRSRKILFLGSLAVLIFFSEILKDLFLLESLKLEAGYLHKPLTVSSDIFSLGYLFKIVFTILAGYAVYYIFRRMSRALFLKPAKFTKAKL